MQKKAGLTAPLFSCFDQEENLLNQYRRVEIATII